MNIPLIPEQQPFFNTSIGNAGQGGAPNRPFLIPQYPGSMPRVNLNPQFQLGEYNNAEESYNFPRFNNYWEQPNQSTYNPIDQKDVTTKIGNAGNGDNQAKGMGAGKRPMAFENSVPNQYSRLTQNVEGCNKYVWPLGGNINLGEPIDIASGEAQEIVNQLIAEMGGIKEEVEDVEIKQEA
jgi:hypothetical protein